MDVDRDVKYVLDGTVVERLVELSNDGVLWPTTEAPGGDGALIGDEWPQTGMLAYLGFHVGQNGVQVGARRQILDYAYEGCLPKVMDAGYMEAWGPPRSSQRLRKMAESLAAFCRNQKRKVPSARAVVEWEDDLEYLRLNYYVGRYDFVWPSTELT